MKPDKTNDVMAPRQAKIDQLKALDIPLYPNDFRATHAVSEIQSMLNDLGGEVEAIEKNFSVAGRMMAINRMGKSTFLRFKDRTGQIQAYARKDKIGDEAYGLLKMLDIGDIVGLIGSLFKTRTGEWTLLVDQMRLLCKAKRPLPEKFHGLKDPEKRYRKRYVDLIMNDRVRQLFIQRSRIIQAIRNFFIERDFLEVETPMMQPIPGGAEAAPFITHHNALSMDLYLRIAPELYLKRLVVGGFERVFEINRNFRNEGISTQHNPEFTMLEFYQAYATFDDFIELTQALVQQVCQQLHQTTCITYQGHTIELGGAWRRISMLDALQEYGQIDGQVLKDPPGMLALAKERGIQVLKADRPAKVITKMFESLVEPQLIQPTFITHYPVEVSPLSRRNDQDPSVTDRFELFVAGREIANGFSELNDPDDQRNRFLQQVAERDAGNKEAHLMDEDYIEALEYGLPPTAGEGIGIDRLVMLLTDAASIREVLLFPHMRAKVTGASETE